MLVKVVVDVVEAVVTGDELIVVVVVATADAAAEVEVVAAAAAGVEVFETCVDDPDSIP